ncbi:MAG: SDR family oxidoreductase [Planctomycetota bacterium]|nr:SDR family oxidoreductase [Planctomycetota bacterium]
MKVDLGGQVALVTGAGNGIGRAIADLLAANGARVAYTDADEAAAGRAAAGKPGCAARRLDVTVPADIEAGARWLLEEFGRIDILVNNAGINTRFRVNLDQFHDDEWDRIVATDLTGCYRVTKAIVPLMLKRKSGRIINIASVFGLVPARLQCAYVAAKAGVVNLTRAMALEFGPYGVLANAVAPGSTLNEGLRKIYSSQDPADRKWVEGTLSHIPLGRPAECEDVAYAVLFLAAPESRYITGTVIVVDGGWTAGFSRDF